MESITIIAWLSCPKPPSINTTSGKVFLSFNNHFGGLQELKQASVEEMQKVNGISPTLATKIAKTLK
jgi:ERCC4-type nuclease